MKAHWRYGLLGVLAAAILIRLLLINWAAFLNLDVSEGFLANGGERAEQIREHLILEQSKLVFLRDAADSSEFSAWDALAENAAIQTTGTLQAIPAGLETILFERRIPLFFPAWLKRTMQEREMSTPDPALLAEQAVADLEQFLQSPDSVGLEDYALLDPLLLLPQAIQSATGPTKSAPGGTIRWAELSASAFDPAFQERVLPLLEQAAADKPWVGAIRFASASRIEIKREVTLLNLLTFSGVAIIVAVFLRRPSSLTHLGVPIFFALTGGIAIFSLIRDDLHIVSLVLGSALTGISLDYGVHLLLHGSPGRQSVLIRSILLAGISSILGFAMILFIGNPVIRDTGLFVTCGLSIALFISLVYPPFFQPHPGLRFQEWFLRRLPISPRTGYAILTSCCVLALWGILSISWRDDLQIMNIEQPELLAEAALIREASGPGHSPSIAIGASYVDALSRLENAAPGGLPSVLPTRQTLQRVQEMAPSHSVFQREMARGLEEAGFHSSLFDPFFTQLGDYLQEVETGNATLLTEKALAAVAENLSRPLSFLLGSHGGIYWAGTPAPIRQQSPEVFSLSESSGLTAKMAGFRRDFQEALLIGTAAIALGLFLLLGVRRGALTFIPLFLCAVLTLGGIALFQPVNLFHLTGILLGLCIGLDYLVFYQLFGESAGRFPVSIRFSFLTTATGFGMLLFSQIIAVQSLGIAVLVLLVAVLFWIECDRARIASRDSRHQLKS